MKKLMLWSMTALLCASCGKPKSEPYYPVEEPAEGAESGEGEMSTAAAPAGEGCTEATDACCAIDQPGVCIKGCEDGNCQQECSSGASCQMSCQGGNCVQTCHPGAKSCVLNCEGGNCQQICTAGANCTHFCQGGNCEQICPDDAARCFAECPGGDCS